MIELIVKDFLETKMAVPVLLEVPKDPPASFIIIEKTGGGQTNYIKSAVLAIKSYAASMYVAAQLNEELKTAMLDGNEGLITSPDIVSVHLNSDYNYTDTSEKRYRYQAVFDVNHY